MACEGGPQESTGPRLARLSFQQERNFDHRMPSSPHLPPPGSALSSVVTGVLARLHALSSSPQVSAPGAPHWEEGEAVPSYLASQGRAAGTALACSRRKSAGRLAEPGTRRQISATRTPAAVLIRTLQRYALSSRAFSH